MSTYRDIQPNHIKNDKLRVICLKNEENKRIVEKFKKKILCTYEKISFHVFFSLLG